MSLATDIIRVIKLTDAIVQSVDESDLDRCGELLPEREEALLRLGLTCRDASPTEIEACRDIMQELESKDVALRSTCQDVLTALGHQLARTVGAKRRRPAQQPLCVDRKA